VSSGNTRIQGAAWQEQAHRRTARWRCGTAAAHESGVEVASFQPSVVSIIPVPGAANQRARESPAGSTSACRSAPRGEALERGEQVVAQQQVVAFEDLHWANEATYSKT